MIFLFLNFLILYPLISFLFPVQILQEDDIMTRAIPLFS